MPKHCILVGAPVDEGAIQPGCLMGPAALRTAGIAHELENLGHSVEDRGDVKPAISDVVEQAALHKLPETVGWTIALQAAAYDAAKNGDFPIFLGGDHSLSAGTVSGVAKAAAEQDRPLFVLWLDAHPDFHRLNTTTSGNLHGTPVAYFTGQDSFAGVFPPLPAPIPATQVCLIGIRSVDPAEHDGLLAANITVHDMRAIDENGVSALLRPFLKRVSAANGLLHVSLDVDFLEPAIAPAVGTTVPGGATFREAHLIMEMLSESGLVSSLDLVELNPFLDERGRTAKLIVDLTASLMGRRVMDRPTRSY